jgi:hypothetical protein
MNALVILSLMSATTMLRLKLIVDPKATFISMLLIQTVHLRFGYLSYAMKS